MRYAAIFVRVTHGSRRATTKDENGPRHLCFVFNAIGSYFHRSEVEMRTLLEDFRYALRMLLKSPGFTVVAVLTLALGIGANTAIFSVVNGLLLHPAGIPHPERIIAVRARYEKLNLKNIVISAPDFTFVRDNSKTFAASAIESAMDFNYTTGSWPLRLRGAQVSGQWFDVFEAKPLLGRVFTPEEDQPNANNV